MVYLKTCLGLVLAVVLISACGKESASYTITGDATIATNVCKPYVVTRSAPAQVNITIQPGIEGNGGVYSDSACTTLAAFNIQIPQGGSVATFYFKSSNPGATTLKITDLSSLVEATFLVTIQ